MNVFVDIAIAVIFVFATIGLMTTAIAEAIASFMKTRAKTLAGQLRDLLGDSEITERFYGNALIRLDRQGEDRMSKKMFEETHPSYISPKAFARSLTMALSDKSVATGIIPDPATILTSISQSISALPPSSLRDFGRAALIDAQGSLDRFETALADRYDETMMRLSGEFKRRQQCVTFLIGFALAAALNIDVIAYAKRLQLDEELRERAVATATAYAELCQASNCVGQAPEFEHLSEDASEEIAAGAKALSEDLKRLNAQLGEAALGWNACSWRAFWDGLNVTLARENCPAPAATAAKSGDDPGEGRFVASVASLFSWLIAAFAAILGAPFWFDILSKFIRLRGTGDKPGEATAENRQTEQGRGDA
ncbi:hypothetical protein E3C22_13220 [Jiella endophytica]|uniref:Uncharacterized protein n=1 Tax=Jiella endophytica TaxID=2558362 RepID=A0A4Y8RHN7_9HYPH|nr:hypothetical protein [Jiella endophytica]TFF21650.1 hypothetical protein E3C22_13220 [Jiella endophytica]